MIAVDDSDMDSEGSEEESSEEEEEADLGPGQITDATSPLGKLLMANSRVELAQSMAEAGEAINVREIQIFTQKGLYARRIMDYMGLPDLNREISDLRTDPRVPARRLGQQLKQRRDFLRGQVRDVAAKLALFALLGKSYTDDEFQDLCFE